MINNHLINAQDVIALARNSSASLDPKDVEVYIDEAEQLNVKPAIGTALFIRLLNGTGDATANRELLYGGQYVNKCGELAMHAGLRKALAYYAYGRMVKNGGRSVTRFGFVEKQGDYSNHIDYRERYASANDASLVADSYMKEVLNYISAQVELYPEYRGCGGMRNRRVTIKAIGE